MFHNCNPCGWNENISAYWDVSKVEDMSYMFTNDGSLNACYENFSLNTWDVSSVKNMSYMFAGNCSTPKIESWDISSVEDMSYMFKNCAFENIKFIEEWDLSQVKNKEGILDGYSEFYSDGTSVDLTGLLPTEN